MNLVTPEYAEKRGWKQYPLEELVLPPSFKSFPPISGVGGCSTDEAAGYVIFNVQVEGIPSYSENQVAIVMPDDSNFSRQVPVVLGTCTVHRVVNVMKESEAKTAPLAWQNVKVAKEIKDEFFCRRAMADDTTYPTNTGMDPLDIDERLVEIYSTRVSDDDRACPDTADDDDGYETPCDDTGPLRGRRG